MGDLLSSLLDWLFVWIVEKPRELVADLFTWLLFEFTAALFEEFFALMPESVQAYLAKIPWQGLTGKLNDVAWILPVWEVLAIVFTAYSICATIRLVRWILAIIPTIGG